MNQQPYEIEDPFYQAMTREANILGTPMDFFLGNLVLSMGVLIFYGVFAILVLAIVQAAGAIYTVMDPDGLTVLMGTLFQASDGANHDVWGGHSYDV